MIIPKDQTDPQKTFDQIQKYYDDNKDKLNLSETELQIKRMEENLKKLRLKAQREKKQKQIDSAMEIYSLLKKHGLQNIDIEVWQAKIGDIANILKN